MKDAIFGLETWKCKFVLFYFENVDEHNNLVTGSSSDEKFQRICAKNKQKQILSSSNTHPLGKIKRFETLFLSTWKNPLLSIQVFDWKYPAE